MKKKLHILIELAEDIKFTVKDGQVITMVDKKILTEIQVNKVSSVTNKPIKSKDFEFTLYADEACTKVLMKANANKEEGTANFPWSALWDILCEGNKST